MTQKEPFTGSASLTDVKQALEVVKGFGQMALGASGVEMQPADLAAIGGAVDDAIQPGTTVEVHITRGEERRVLVRFQITADPPLEIA